MMKIFESKFLYSFIKTSSLCLWRIFKVFRAWFCIVFIISMRITLWMIRYNNNNVQVKPFCKTVLQNTSKFKAPAKHNTPARVETVSSETRTNAYKQRDLVSTCWHNCDVSGAELCKQCSLGGRELSMSSKVSFVLIASISRWTLRHFG